MTRSYCLKETHYVLRYENLNNNMVDEMMKVTAFFFVFMPSKQRIKYVLQDQEGLCKRQNRTPVNMA